MIRFWSTERE